jgi:uncharacterized MAPEG superfamily protein
MEPRLALELKLLLAAVGIGVIQLVLAAASARSQQNLTWAAGARDEPMPALTGVPGRLDRAFRNFMETFPFFAVAVIVVYLAGRSGGVLSIWGCLAYVVARAVYVPLYAAGVPRIRTLVWAVSIIGILMVIAASLA